MIKSVPADSTAVGVPARVVRGPHVEKTPSVVLQHGELPDPVTEALRAMENRLRDMEGQVLSLGQLQRQRPPAEDATDDSVSTSPLGDEEQMTPIAGVGRCQSDEREV